MTSSIQTETLTLTAGGRTLKHYVAFDASAPGKRPGIAVFPEWWGHNEYVKRRARELAGLGYVALAVDVYGDGKLAADSTEAGTLMNGLFADMAATTERLRATIEALGKHARVDGTRVGAMGYCLGGALSLHAARIGLPLRGVASFHGSLGKTHPAKPGDVKAAVLVCHGGADKLVPLEDIANFHKEMSELGADLTYISYPNALHGYSNPEATEKGKKYGLPLAYDAATDARSWADMQAFWKRVFA